MTGRLTGLCECGHPKDEHRIEVLPFDKCRHVESHDLPNTPRWKWAGYSECCPCTGFKAAKA